MGMRDSFSFCPSQQPMGSPRHEGRLFGDLDQGFAGLLVCVGIVGHDSFDDEEENGSHDAGCGVGDDPGCGDFHEGGTFDELLTESFLRLLRSFLLSPMLALFFLSSASWTRFSSNVLASNSVMKAWTSA